MQRRILAVIILILLICSSCKREGELQGSVFIVTKGSENYKLGLVMVSAIPEDKMRQFVKTKKAYISTQLDRLKSSLDSYRVSIATAQKSYDAAKKTLDTVLAEKDALVSKDEELNSKLNPNLGEFTEEVDASVLQGEQVRQAKIQQQLQAVRQQMGKYQLLVEDARNKLGVADKQLSDVKSQAADNEQKMMTLLNEAMLYEGVPDGNVKAITDADGKFVLRLPTSGKYALAARADRRIFNSTEHYYWLIWVNLDGQETKQVMLSNQNMLGQDSDDVIFNFKELITKEVSGTHL